MPVFSRYLEPGDGKVTFKRVLCCGPTSTKRSFSNGELPIMKVPAGTITWYCPEFFANWLSGGRDPLGCLQLQALPLQQVNAHVSLRSPARAGNVPQPGCSQAEG